MFPAFAAQGVIRGVVHDPAHRPIAAAQVSASATEPARSETVATSADGEFQFDNMAEGTWTLAVSAPGFQRLERSITVAAGRSPVLHLEMQLAGVNEVVTVSSAADRLNAQTATPRVLIDQEDVARTPGADQTNSLAMITDFTPGAYMVHDMLHMRGGHQVNWLIDGVPVINTNIAANVAPIVNPKDRGRPGGQRGGYSSEYGDRTYGFFNVVTPSGFERDNQADLIFSAGNFYSTDDQLSIRRPHPALRLFCQRGREPQRARPGDARLPGNPRSGKRRRRVRFPALQFERQRPIALGGLGARRPLPNSQRFRSRQAAGIRDLDLEKDDLGGFHWTHTFPSDGADGLALATTSTARTM